jgi:6-phosphogluconolactonase
MSTRRFRDLAAIARAMADELPTLVGTGGNLVLSGGNTPRALHAELVARGRDYLPWDAIDLWWGDERCVPPDHADSNYGMAKATLIDPLGLTRWHRMRGEDPPDAAARAYEAELGATQLDVIFLGIGSDGHTASLFPGTQIDPARSVIASQAPSGQPRISLTPRVINAARHVRFLVTGAEKATVLAEILNGASEAPATQIRNPDLAWLVDETAATRL